MKAFLTIYVCLLSFVMMANNDHQAMSNDEPVKYLCLTKKKNNKVFAIDPSKKISIYSDSIGRVVTGHWRLLGGDSIKVGPRYLPISDIRWVKMKDRRKFWAGLTMSGVGAALLGMTLYRFVFGDVAYNDARDFAGVGGAGIGAVGMVMMISRKKHEIGKEWELSIETFK